MQVNLNHPRIDDASMLTGADLEEARRHNPGSIWQISPHRLMPHGLDQQGRQQTRQWGNVTDDAQPEACAPEGGKHAEPAATKTQRDRPGLGVALVLLGWPAVAALVAVAAFIAEHLPMVWPLG